MRPLGPQGKLQLAKDLAELQLAVGQSLYPLEQLVLPYRTVKAFRALLFQAGRVSEQGGFRSWEEGCMNPPGEKAPRHL